MQQSQEEFSKCDLAKSLDKAVRSLEEINEELKPFSTYSSESKHLSFQDIIDAVLEDPKLLGNKNLKSKVLGAAEDMLNMLKRCGSQSERILYEMAEKLKEINKNIPEIADSTAFVGDNSDNFL
ncbi:hypothetical protein [Wolbachia endosymbiont of Ctenocephalides felis wCfeT]|uniref:hypothetical protein n=1 Tax=Wolbachia endosymbiont of Ctenocephalides felis wCfeT TaxID=2732593 RepID=UPI0014480E4C|nr:hypothetical protein [Wolbachia endosymbiont of Ctenocephalides felis wCfeT]